MTTNKYVLGSVVLLADGEELIYGDGGAVLLGEWSGDILVSSTKFGELIYRVARECHLLTGGKATGGSTTSIIDTNYRTEDDDWWKGVGATSPRMRAGAALPRKASTLTSLTSTTRPPRSPCWIH